MNRFFKTFSLLLVALLLLVTGVNATLDRLAHTSQENCYTLYAESGHALYAYNGDLDQCEPYVRPEPVLPRHVLHRVKATNS